MSFILSALGAICDLWNWFRGSTEERLGKTEQQNVDAKETVKILEAERDVNAQRVDALEQLREDKF